ncbi:hypothetical protein C1646_769515 [Rhizophagus diaphanus]|nr:hypothetical protein C1646_769515 [Rhizophagus diaphanus] [Rhizophagus sp. MUCL 43196]
MTDECSNSENLFPADNQHEVVEKLETGFKKFNDKFTNLLEENQRIKQHNKNLQEKNQEISRTNLELNNKYQEISRNNSKLIEENEKILRINNDLKEKFQNINEQFEKLQKDLNLEKQKNKEIQRLEVISQNLEKNLKILEVDEIDINTVNAFKENNEQKNCNINNNPTTFALNNIERSHNIRIIVGLDFGVTYSGFSYCHVNDDQNIYTNCDWPGKAFQSKTNTVLQYDDEYINVLCWGAEALSVRPNRKNRKQNSKPVELFKLYLGDLPDNLKPILPIDYKKAITDYLREIGKLIKENIRCNWHGIDYSENVLLVLTIPAEYSETDKVIMRQCVYNANLIEDIYSRKLQFATESEATAIYCLKDYFNYEIEGKF